VIILMAPGPRYGSSSLESKKSAAWISPSVATLGVGSVGGSGMAGDCSGTVSSSGINTSSLPLQVCQVYRCPNLPDTGSQAAVVRAREILIRQWAVVELIAEGLLSKIRAAKDADTVPR
jgi:hypothetical protein